MNITLPSLCKSNTKLPQPDQTLFYDEHDREQKAILNTAFTIELPLYGIRVTAKAGFIYDGFSVPFAFHWIQQPFTGVLPAALTHDILRDTRCVSRWRADRIFLYILKMYGEKKTLRNILYGAVALFGGFHKIRTQAQIDHALEFLEIGSIPI